MTSAFRGREELTDAGPVGCAERSSECDAIDCDSKGLADFGRIMGYRIINELPSANGKDSLSLFTCG
jgi:hypothetical protein